MRCVVIGDEVQRGRCKDVCHGVLDTKKRTCERIVLVMCEEVYTCKYLAYLIALSLACGSSARSWTPFRSIT